MQKCKAVFLSPLFYIKKSKNFLDIHKFNYLTQNNKIHFYALGGISADKICKGSDLLGNVLKDWKIYN